MSTLKCPEHPDTSLRKDFFADDFSCPECGYIMLDDEPSSGAKTITIDDLISEESDSDSQSIDYLDDNSTNCDSSRYQPPPVVNLDDFITSDETSDEESFSEIINPTRKRLRPLARDSLLDQSPGPAMISSVQKTLASKRSPSPSLKQPPPPKRQVVASRAPNVRQNANRLAFNSTDYNFKSLMEMKRRNHLVAASRNLNEQEKRSQKTTAPEASVQVVQKQVLAEVSKQQIVQTTVKTQVSHQIVEKPAKAEATKQIVQRPVKPVAPKQITLQKISPPETSKQLIQRPANVPKVPDKTQYALGDKIVLTADRFLITILKWNVAWLKEYYDGAPMPPICPSPLVPLKLAYESVEDYQKAYIPLILCEIWSCLYENRLANTIDFDVGIDHYGVEDRFIVLDAKVVTSKNFFKDNNNMIPKEGDLVSIELILEELPPFLTVFGYVSDYNVETVTSSSNTSFLVLPQGPSVLLNYQIKICKRAIGLKKRTPMKMRNIYYLKPTIRQLELLNCLDKMMLHRDILAPRDVTCQFIVPTNSNSTLEHFNESQSKAIRGSFEAISRPYAIPKLLLIQGPPGTGKTHTLIGIIKYIYLNWEDQSKLPKILVCAPSNGAVDEIAKRLYPARKFLKLSKANRDLRMVRVGISSQVHPDVKRLTIEHLTDENIKLDKEGHLKKVQDKTDIIERKIAQLDQELANYRAMGNKVKAQKVEEEMNNYAKELLRIGNKNIPEVSTSRKRNDIMQHVDVVFTTLNSCRQSAIELIYKIYGPNTFNCVIVDEASQCCEPELLMPLSYGMTKMILIGDPMQLPATVISKSAEKYQFGRSLFERFYNYFNEKNKSDMVLMLDQQYRMHPEICKFPSKMFYSGKLKTNELVAKRKFPSLAPYVVFDLIDTDERRNENSSSYNVKEADFDVKVLMEINKILANTEKQRTVGIITPYQGQKSVIEEKIAKMPTELKVKVDVNTIDGFQGQERDVIIISLVRANRSGDQKGIGFLKSSQRMNVALTRAKYSLVVCGSCNTLKVEEKWKQLVEDAQSRNKYYKVKSTVDEKAIKEIMTNV